MDTVIAPSERGEDLVAYSASLGGDRVDVVSRTDQFGKAARAGALRVESSHVDCHEIHRDASNHRNSLVGDRGAAAIAERPQPAIGVADGNCRDSAGTLPAMRRTVANGVASVNVASLQNSLFQTNHMPNGNGMSR